MGTNTRRQLLTVVAAAGGFAGCLGSESGASESTSHTATEGRGRDIPDEKATRDPPRVVRRTVSESPPIRLRSTEGETIDDSPPRERGRHIRTALLTSASATERLVHGTSEGTTTDELSSFVSATDFEAESLYLETERVEACFRLSLCYISWQDDGIRTAYSRELRPYDDRCSADAKAFESRLFRLPIALDEESINSYGTSVGSGRCRAGSTPDEPPNESHRPEANTSQPSNGSESV